MRKLAISALVLILLLGGAFVVSGQILTSRIAEQPSSWVTTVPGLKVVEQKVDKGVLRSTNELTVQLGCLPAANGAAREPLRITWRDEIQHGPVVGGTGLALAHISSELRVLGSVGEKLSAGLQGKPLLRVETQVGLSGALVSDFELGALTFKQAGQGAIETTAFRGQVQTTKAPSPDGSDFALTSPGAQLHLVTPKGDVTMTLGAITSKSVVGKRDPALPSFPPTTSSGTLATLAFEVGGAAAAQLPFKLALKLDDVAFESSSKVEAGLLTTSTQMHGRARIGEYAIDKLEVAGGLRHIDAAAYQQLMTKSMADSLRCDAAPAADPDKPALSGELAAILQRDPAYAVDKLAIEVGGRRAEIAYTMGAKGVTEPEVATLFATPALLMQKAAMQGKASIDLTLLTEIAAKVAAIKAPPGSDPDAQVATMRATIEATVAQLAAQGFVQREGAVLSSAFTYEQAKLLVNGKPIPLPPLGQGSGHGVQ